MTNAIPKRIRVLDPPMSRSKLSTMMTSQLPHQPSPESFLAPRADRSDAWYPSFYEDERDKWPVSVMWTPQLDVLAPDIIGSTPLDVSFCDHALRKLKELRAYDRAIFDSECWKRGIDPDEIFGKEDE